VHGGHVLKDDDPATGYDNWCKTFERMDLPLPVLIENTAGGGNAMARRLDRVAALWEAMAARCDLTRVGFCLDTCHAHAGGEALDGLVKRVLSATGRIDLVHANDSRDAFDSGADRHANLGAGRIDPDALLEVVREAGAPVVCETPGGADGQGTDVRVLRERLGGRER
jgi:deoxyribonuclease-4